MKVIASIGLLLSLFGVYSVFIISFSHFVEQSACPTLGFLPVCYLVLMAYSLISLGWFGALVDWSILKRNSGYLFWLGFVLAFVFAVIGVSGEIFGFADCPMTETGLPKCFISFGVLVLIMVIWVFQKFITKQKQSK